MSEPRDNENGRQPDEFGSSGGLAPDDDETGTDTGRTTGTYSDAGDENDPPGQGDAEAGG